MIRVPCWLVWLGLFLIAEGHFNRIHAAAQIDGNFPHSTEEFLRIKNEESPTDIIYEGILLPPEGVFRKIIIDFKAISFSSPVYVDTFIYDLGWDLRDLLKFPDFREKKLIKDNPLACKLMASAAIVQGQRDGFVSFVTSNLHLLDPIIEQVLAYIKRI